MSTTHRTLDEGRLEDIRSMLVSSELSRWTLHILLCRGVQPWEIVAWLELHQGVSRGWIWCTLRSAGWPVDQCVAAFRLARWSADEVIRAALRHPARSMVGCGWRRGEMAAALRGIAERLERDQEDQ
ncbi:MAG TPA: hypothetical protein PKC43_06395 [Phycisphaerales bacterium]|nr:hypothetical protein [Phycisphaerales bacterium]HMP37062.1 hypothetical protein [Phycisphaerales bacterium]